MSVTEVTTGVVRAQEPATARLRVGVVGAGFIAGVHARAARSAGARLIGAVASSPERAADAAGVLGAEHGYADLETMLGHAELDVVHICTPNALHHAAVLEAVAAGIQVICEKPLATSLAEAIEMAEAAEHAGVVGSVPFVYRYHPMVREMRGRIARGDAGKLSSFQGSYLQDWLSRVEDRSWRIDARSGGQLRAFGDIGSHWCDLLEYVVDDRIVRLAARTAVVLDRDGGQSDEALTEDVATVTFQTSRGALGVLVVSQVAAGRKNRLHLEVSGTESSYAFDQENPELLWVGRRDGSLLLQRDPAQLVEEAARVSHLPAGHAQGYQDCFNSFVADSYAAGRGEAPDGLPTFADGVRAARIAEAVLGSVGQDGAWTDVSL